ncbi:VOC family protein [Flavobacterium sp. 3HN19-14]|uniref:VOC family protein n=1 Tax=Flavobacterium sp. 3HN19-14 TaxID=3448133 RepID=UPI003EE15E8C
MLEFKILGSFENHSNYNGIFIGNPESDWHFEFTSSPENPVHQPDDDDLIVLYPTEKTKFDQLLQNIKNRNIKIRQAKNPYWNENGILIQDPDGYGIVIAALKIR